MQLTKNLFIKDVTFGDRTIIKCEHSQALTDVKLDSVLDLGELNMRQYGIPTDREALKPGKWMSLELTALPWESGMYMDFLIRHIEKRERQERSYTWARNIFNTPILYSVCLTSPIDEPAGRSSLNLVLTSEEYQGMLRLRGRTLMRPIVKEIRDNYFSSIK